MIVYKFLILAIFVAFLLFNNCPTDAESPNQVEPPTFTNPIVEDGADPWVIRWEDFYYCCFSSQNKIWVRQSRNLHEIGGGIKSIVWTPPAGMNYAEELWAPELHYLKGKWYIYVAADNGNNYRHRMFVLDGSSENPQDNFVFKGKIADPTDRWAIDGTMLEMDNGDLYFIWTGWEGMVNIQQNLYIAPMRNPGG